MWGISSPVAEWLWSAARIRQKQQKEEEEYRKWRFFVRRRWEELGSYAATGGINRVSCLIGSGLDVSINGWEQREGRELMPYTSFDWRVATYPSRDLPAGSDHARGYGISRVLPGMPGRSRRVEEKKTTDVWVLRGKKHELLGTA